MSKIDQLKTENLAAGGKFQLDEIPVRKFFDQVQYVEKTLLPAIEKKSGKDSADYQFFQGIRKSLLYAVMVVDRANYLVNKTQQLHLSNRLLREQLILVERELMKYTTMEDLYMTDAMDRVAESVKTRVENLLK